MSSSIGANSFFLQHKDLFEFDKYVGGGPITASTPSFLSRYRECERLQVIETANFLDSQSSASLVVTATLPVNAMFTSPTTYAGRNAAVSITNIMDTTSISASHSHNGASYSISSHPPQFYSPPSSPSRFLRGSGDPRGVPTLNSLHDYNHRGSPYEAEAKPRSPQRRMPSPQRSPQRFTHAQEAHTSNPLPKLSDLLIDASSRAVLLGPGKGKVDEAKKIELLIGSKCVGRVSAASNLPPAIRRRLHTSAQIHKRREALYLLLKGDFMRLTES